jgi:hypothetical protein
VLRTLAPEVLMLCNAFDTADSADSIAQTSACKEVREGEQVLAALRQQYEPIRELASLANLNRRSRGSIDYEGGTSSAGT